jgi:hypothetical protein
MWARSLARDWGDRVNESQDTFWLGLMGSAGFCSADLNSYLMWHPFPRPDLPRLVQNELCLDVQRRERAARHAATWHRT